MKYRIREQNELKSSGVEWLGDIPNSWYKSKMSYYYKVGMGQTILKEDLKDNGQIPVYSATAEDKFFGFIDDASILLFKDDLVIPARGNSIGYVKLVKEISTTTQTTIYCKKISKSIYSEFIFYYMKGLKEKLFYFIQTAIPQITVNEVLSNPVLIPSLLEQQKIANFLDEKSKIFDDAISKKEQLISKLELAKQSLISEVVTGKLKIIENHSKLQTIKREKNELKASDVEWLGDIPKDWQVKKLGYIFSFKNGVNTDSSNYGKGIKFINVKETINTNFIMENDIEGSVLVSDSIIKENSVRKGDVLFNRTSETIEELALSTVYYDDKVALFGGFVIRGRQITKDLDLDFKRYCFQSMEMRKQIISYGSGSIRKNIAQTNLKNVYLFVPTITEQQKISKYLDEKLIHFDNTIEKTKRSISKLKEAKEALINQAVTGKIEVL